ncbi:MAG: BamA/TamA family outer membrane protein [Marinibacterium sp.]
MANLSHRLLAVLPAVLVAMGSLSAGARAQSVSEQQTAPIQADTDQPSIGFGDGSLIVAPIPFSNPMIGSGLALGAGYLFQLDAESDRSVLGLGAMKSDNGSQAYGLSASVAFGSNRWQASLLAARADLSYDLITPAARIPLDQTGDIARLTLAYGLTPDLSLGLMGRYLRTDISPSAAIGLPPPLQLDADLSVATVGLTGEYDRRDDDLYPTSGSRLYLSVAHNEVIDGLARGKTYAKAYATWDLFRPIGSRAVLAVRLAACAAAPDTPFYDECSLGGTDAMRGFNVTRFLDNRLLSAQIELRARITKRLGGVVFAGTGAVGPAFDSLGDPGTAGGIGLRYRVSKKFPVEFSVDVSHNSLDEQLLYIYVGQRF